ADEHRGTRNELADLMLAFAAEGAVEGVLRVAGWLGHRMSVGQPRRVAIMLGQASKPAQPVFQRPDRSPGLGLPGGRPGVGPILSASGRAWPCRGSDASPAPRPLDAQACA